MTEHVTPTQALLIFGLLAVHGECAQADLMPAVLKADREALAKAGLIDAKKIGRPYFLSLTERGWDWAGSNLSAELPSPQKALHELLGRLGEHLVKTDGSLAALIGSKPPQKVETKPRPSKSKAGTTARKAKPKADAGVDAPKAAKKNSKPKMPTPTALRARIEVAYMALTGGRKNESVRLANLREKLSDLDRATIDAALGRILKSDKKASLMRHDDPAQLDQADHAAAFSPAGEPFHVIWIAS